jgi:hypothetical protein
MWDVDVAEELGNNGTGGSGRAGVDGVVAALVVSTLSDLV